MYDDIEEEENHCDGDDVIKHFSVKVKHKLKLYVTPLLSFFQKDAPFCLQVNIVVHSKKVYMVRYMMIAMFLHVKFYENKTNES